MQGNDESSVPDDGGTDSGIGAEPVEKKAAMKQPQGAANTDSNPDRV